MKFIKSLLSDTWTYIGLAIAFFTLDGSARKITGIIIAIGMLVWLISLPLRIDDDSE
jgi:hypothetical protein